MAEPSEEDQSMNGGRSLNLFDWLLLPFLSLFNFRRRDANCAQVEAPIRAQPNDQLKLNDLPLLALLAICGHLKPASQERYTDLYNFRNTCRAFTSAVNSFFENSANLPPMNRLGFSYPDSKIVMHVWMERINYAMHPLKPKLANGEVKDRSENRVSVTAELDANNDEAIELAAESLSGPVKTLEVYIASNHPEVIKKMLKIPRNVIFTNLSINSLTVTNEMRYHILAYLREHSNLDVTVYCDEFDNVDAPEFLTQLYSSTKSIFLESVWNRFPLDFHNRSNAFWEQYLLQKLHEGAKVKCNNRTFTKQTDLTGVLLRAFELSKC